MLIAVLAAVLAVGVSTASAVTLTPTTAPLAGSNFQGGDGNETNPVGDVSQPPDGVNDIDWQAISSTPGAIDTTNPDMAFSGGDKESEPGKWAFAAEGSGVNPSKDNLLGAWSTSAPSVSGPPNAYLYLAYTREAQTGNTFNTFELNQLAQTWNNGNANITCRTTGDLLISYEVASGGSPPNVDIVVYRWIADTSDAVTGCSKTGHFQAIDPQPNAEAGVNAANITNFLSTGTFGNTFLQGTFGEAALNLTAILSGANLNPCENFGQISMHTRSSTSIDSQLQDYISPVPVIVRSCSLAIKKTGSSPHHDGDSETFNYEVTNDGTVPVTVSKASNTGVTDDKCAPVTYVSGDTNNDGKLDLSEKWVFTCSYTVKHSDENASHDIINTATVHGSVDNTPITRSTTYTTHVIHPALDVTKTAAETAVHVGDAIHYTVTVTNTGDTSLTVTPADTGCTGFNSASFTLAAGASKQLTCTHTVTAADGTHYDNQACAQGIDAIGGANGTVSDCDHVDVPILHPGIAVTKTAAETAAHVGDTIHYTITVDNTGDTRLTVNPSDLGCTSFDNTSFSLAAGASKTLTCVHVATAGDGASYKNQACAQGVDSVGGAKGTVSDCDDVTVPILHPGIAVTKTAAETAAHVGDTIHYTIKVANTGDTALSITPADVGCTGFDSSTFSLAPGASKTLSCAHAATAADGASYKNQACAQGIDSIGGPKGTVSDCDDVTVPILHPGIKVTKDATESAVHVGDTIHYSIKVENTGDAALTVAPSDLGCTTFDNSSFTLAAGASKTLTCAHAATAGDGGSYKNQACAQGVDSIGGPAGTVSDCDDVTVPILHPGIKVDKTAAEPAVHVGDTINYTIKVSNTGDTTLTVSPSDVGCTGFDNSSFSLAAGGSKTLTCTHQATAGDGTAKANEACAQGVDSIAGAKGTVSDCDTVTTDVIHPAIHIDKTERIAGQASYVDGPITAFVGDPIEYEMTVTNSGDTPLAVAFTDAHCDGATLTGPTGDTNADGKLDASETWVYHCSHLLTNGDKPSFTNTAHVDGTDKLGETVSDEDSVLATTSDFKISGHKFEDQNANGQKDAGEPGIAAWTFFLDANNNGQLDQGETSVKTDANGGYQFSGLNPGSYVVREVIPSGWHCSTPSPCEYHFTLTAGDPDRTNADFGNWHESTVAGTKFHDRNANGGRDGGDEGLGGWTFYVDYNGNGAKDAGEPSDTSAADGSYKIGGIKPGTFAVREVGQGGWTCSFPASCEYDLTFKSNDAKSGADFGNWEPASVSGTKFEDTNGNGKRDPGEGPLQGFTFYVDYDGNGTLDAGEPAAVSAADGSYMITGVKPGTFTVRELADPNYTCTAPGTGSACAYGLTFQAGDAQTGMDFGNQPPAQIVSPERVTPGSARLIGATGCAAKAFNARVRGTKVKTVTFVLDGKTIKRFTKTSRSGVYAVRINPAKMRIGVHRLVVSVTFRKGSGTKPKKLRLSFQRCARKLVTPRFTG